MNMFGLMWRTAPRTLFRKVRRKLLRSPSDSFDLDEISESTKLIRPQRYYDFLNRYETILRRAAGWANLEFEGARVLEIGCGPLLGWAPLALFRGCGSFVGIEPQFNPAVLQRKDFVTRYFRPVFKDLTALFGPRMTFDAFLDALRERAVIYRQPLNDVDFSLPANIILSNSCLEHISLLDESLVRLRALAQPQARFIHLVDFGNHRATRSPFSGMYQGKPAEYFARYGRHVNLLRPTDMVNTLRRCGFNADYATYISAPEDFDEIVSDYWRLRYTNEELFTKTALVFGQVEQSRP